MATPLSARMPAGGGAVGLDDNVDFRDAADSGVGEFLGITRRRRAGEFGLGFFGANQRRGEQDAEEWQDFFHDDGEGAGERRSLRWLEPTQACME